MLQLGRPGASTDVTADVVGVSRLSFETCNTFDLAPMGVGAWMRLGSLSGVARLLRLNTIQRMARPACKRFPRSSLVSLRQRIRSRNNAPAKMEIRAFWSS